MRKKPSLTYVLSHPIQYISPLLRSLSQKCNLEVYYFSDASVRGAFDKGFGRKVVWDVPLLDGYQSKFVKNLSPYDTVSNRFFELINPDILGQLRKSNAEIVVVNGWMYFSFVFTMIAAKLLGKQLWLRAENPLHQELRKRGWVLSLKKILLGRLIFPMVDRFLYIGSHSKAFFEYYGVKPGQLIYTPYSVDNERFAHDYETLRSQRAALRQELGIPADAKVILSTAKYITPKRPLDLLAAFAQLNLPNACLVMVGDGPMRGEMESFIAKESLQNVYLTGFVNQSHIPKYYAVADVFVLCSGMGETWGLSVNEAMNFALPVCVSNTCGCSADLVQNNVNGFTFNEGDVAALAESLRRTLTDEVFRKEAGAASQRLIKPYSIDTIVTNLLNAATDSAN